MLERKQTGLDGNIRHELIGYLCVDKKYVGIAHSHPFAETLYIVEGVFVLEYFNHQMKLTAGEAVVIRSGMEHHVRCVADGCMCYIGCSYILAGGVTSFPDDMVRMITDQQVLDNLATASRVYIEAQINETQIDHYELLSPLDRYWRKLAANTVIPGSDDVLIVRAKEYIEHHLDEQINVSVLAKQFYITPHYLGVKFHKCVGMTIKEYHTALRMDRARFLIEHSSFSLSEIAMSMGYSTLQYFSTSFKSYYGISPRNLQRGEH